MGVFIQSHLSLTYKSSVSMCVLYVPSCPSVNFQAFVQTLKCFIKGPPPSPPPPLPERTVKLTRSSFSYAKLVAAVWIWMFSSENMFAKIKVRRYTLIGTLPYSCRTTYLDACDMKTWFLHTVGRSRSSFYIFWVQNLYHWRRPLQQKT